MRRQLEDQIKTEKAQAEAGTKADELAGQIKTRPISIASPRERLAVGDSGLFAPRGAARRPRLRAGRRRRRRSSSRSARSASKLQTTQGFAWITLVEIKPSALPTLDRGQGQGEGRRHPPEGRRRRQDAGRDDGEGRAGELRRGRQGRRRRGQDDRPHHARHGACPKSASISAVEDVVFTLKAGETSGAIATDNAVVVARVKERQDVKPEDMAAGKDALRDELLDQRRGAFFTSYMTHAREKMTINFNQEAIQMVLGAK